jgi:hypothetical protein
MSWNQLREIAIGQCGLSIRDFYDADLKDIMDTIHGYTHKQEQMMRLSWEQTRWLGTIVLQPHLGKGKSLKPKDLIQFNWEAAEVKPKRVISEEQLEYRRRMDEFMKKQHGIA